MAAILLAILVIVCPTKLIFQLETGFDGSNPNMKFGRNLIKNDLVRVTTTVDGCKLIGGGHFVDHLSYRLSEKTHLNQGLMEAVLYETWKKSD